MKLLNLGCGSCCHRDWVNVDFRSTGPKVIPCNLSYGLPFADESFEVIYHSHLLEHFSRCYAPVLMQECYRVHKRGGIIRVVVPDLEKIARLYLDLLERAIKGDEKAQKQYDWIMLEMFEQMVRNQSGGEMLNYWKQNPMPAEDFVIERCGSEVLNALAVLRNPSNSEPAAPLEARQDLEEEVDPRQIGEFRLSGEIHQWMYDRHSLAVLFKAAGFRGIRVCRADESDIPGFNSYRLDIEAIGSIRKPDYLFMEAYK